MSGTGLPPDLTVEVPSLEGASGSKEEPHGGEPKDSGASTAQSAGSAAAQAATGMEHVPENGFAGAAGNHAGENGGGMSTEAPASADSLSRPKEEGPGEPRLERAFSTDLRTRDRPKDEEFAKKPKAPRQLTESEIMKRKERAEAKEREEAAISQQHGTIKNELAKQAEARLQYLLKQSDIFKHFGAGKLMGDAGGAASKKKGKGKKAAAAASSSGPLSPGKHRREGGGAGSDDEIDDDSKEGKGTYLTKQPSIIIGGQMRHYQLEGLNWMIRLNENGINGILADEMGLGKTLQSISILAWMHEYKGVSGPHLVLVPKSTLSNWINEFKRWCPALRPLRFHGDKAERARIISEVLKPGHDQSKRTWDVCVTTYEVASMEKSTLQKFAWRYLIIDEAHRLKNEASMFSQTVRQLKMQCRLLLTGTPLQNNLHELWALLNFLLPDVFSSAEEFDQWFNLEIDDDEAKERMIQQLHKILRPFMLRRLKADVEKSLPPKSETILFVGMSTKQKELYRNVLLRDIELINGTGGGANRTAILNIVMQLRKCCNHPYLFPAVEDRTLDPLGEHLVENCGKMVLLSKLLIKMKERGHRVLIFTQMSRVLDILEDFCVMRGYQYCRIDGNTSYDVREDSIDAFNRPNSEKFIFMLSTRAGGLGINLQTADTVILYDSDWNPQADLQAMDRAHRIGQTKPVQVFRLVTENTVEEKVVERAQQKLKLDAMVVQSGRLAENNKRFGKDELLDALRFGADKVFRSKDSAISDADIDAILEQGKKRTQEMEEKLKAAEKGDLLDFKLDGGMPMQEFEGIDYSKSENRMDNSIIPFHYMDTGKRDRKGKPSSYKEEAFYRAAAAMHMQRKKVSLLPKHLRLPAMNEWQFYDSRRLEELHDEEEARYAKGKELGLLPTDQSNLRLLSEEKQAEKERLLSEGFGDWNRPQYQLFIRASAKHGRRAYSKIAADVGKSEEDVAKYATVFWEKGEQFLAPADFERHQKNVEKGEKRIEEIQRLSEATRAFIAKFGNPWEQLTFQYAGSSSSHVKSSFNAQEDRYLLCLADKYGYGNWDQVKAAIRRSDRFRFDYYLRSCSAEALGRRCETLMRAAEKENTEWERRHAHTATGRAGENDRQSEEAKHAQEDAERAAKLKDFEHRFRAEARNQLEMRSGLKAKSRSSGHSAAAAPAAAKHAAAAPSTSYAAAAAGGSGGDDSSSLGGGGSGAAKAAAAAADQTHSGRSSGAGSHAGSGEGGVKHSSQIKLVPEQYLPELAEIVLRGGIKGIDKLCTEFVANHSECSKRQVEKKIQEIGVKQKRENDTREHWYVREEYANLLDPEKAAALKAAAEAAAAAAAAAGSPAPGSGSSRKRKASPDGVKAPRAKRPSEIKAAEARARARAAVAAAAAAVAGNAAASPGAGASTTAAAAAAPPRKRKLAEGGGEKGSEKRARTGYSIFKAERKEEARAALAGAGGEGGEPTAEDVRARVKTWWQDATDEERQRYDALAGSEG